MVNLWMLIYINDLIYVYLYVQSPGVNFHIILITKKNSKWILKFQNFMTKNEKLKEKTFVFSFFFWLAYKLSCKKGRKIRI